MLKPSEVIATLSHVDVKEPAVLASIEQNGSRWRWRAEVADVPDGFSKMTAFDALQDAIFNIASHLELNPDGFRMGGNLPAKSTDKVLSQSVRRRRAQEIAAALMSSARKQDLQPKAFAEAPAPKRAAAATQWRAGNETQNPDSPAARV
jgi:hypothetical protein